MRTDIQKLDDEQKAFLEAMDSKYINLSVSHINPAAEHAWIGQMFGFVAINRLRIEIEHTSRGYNENLLVVHQVKQHPRYAILIFRHNENTESKMVAHGKGATLFEAYIAMREDYAVNIPEDEHSKRPEKKKLVAIAEISPSVLEVKNMDDLF